MSHECKCLNNNCCCTVSIQLPQFKSYDVLYNGPLLPEYYASHLNVGSVDNQYQLAIQPPCENGCPIHVLRLVSSGGGIANILVDRLSGNFNQIQLNVVGSFVKLVYKNCMYSVLDGSNFTCV